MIEKYSKEMEVCHNRCNKRFRDGGSADRRIQWNKLCRPYDDKD